jgi:SAM-dependent methyltransferase
MSLEQTHRAERIKWDNVAQQELGQAATMLPYADFSDYARRSGKLSGIAEFFGDLRGQRVLEYGCGLGRVSALLAKSGAEVSAFDISERSVEVTRRRAELNGLVVDAIAAVGESLPYADASFDIVFGQHVLHHLDVEQASAELLRVLRPGGKAAFLEPMGMNPILNFARDHLPYIAKTERGADEPVDYADIEAWGHGFGEFHFQELEFLSMIERAFGYHVRINVLRRIDKRLMARFPVVRPYCRRVVLSMVKSGDLACPDTPGTSDALPPSHAHPVAV